MSSCTTLSCLILEDRANPSGPDLVDPYAGATPAAPTDPALTSSTDPSATDSGTTDTGAIDTTTTDPTTTTTTTDTSSDTYNSIYKADTLDLIYVGSP